MSFKLTSSGVTYPDGTTQTTKFDSNDDRGKLISINSWGNGSDGGGTYTWNRPSGCTKIRVICVGGGGGASGHCEGGGSGGYSERWIENPPASVTVTVGGGGSGGGYFSNRPDGGTSSFGSYLSASGGYGANRNWRHSGGHGGIGHGGDINLRGGGGGGHENEAGSKSGQSYWGGGGPATHHNYHSNNSENHCSPGSGGMGTWTSHGRGRNGKAGMVVVWNFK